MNKKIVNVCFFVIICVMFFCGSYIFYHEKKIVIKITINNLMWRNINLKNHIEHTKRMNEIQKSNYKLDIMCLQNKIHNLKNLNTRVRKVKITFYSPELGGINSDSDPSNTALMQKPKAGLTCAISRNLVELGWLGQKIYIEGIGIRIVNDLMGKSVNGNKIVDQIDIVCQAKDIKKLTRALGKNTDITATII